MFLPGSRNENFQERYPFTMLPPDSPTRSLSVSRGSSSSFLPGYLLDNNHTQHRTMSNSRLWSSGMDDGPVQQGMGCPGSLSMTPSGQDFIRRKLIGAKAGAPPVKGLYSSSIEHDSSYTDMFSYSRTRSLPALRRLTSSTTTVPPSSGSWANKELEIKNQSQTLPVSSAQNDPLSTQRNVSSDVDDETWITVFGFPPGGSSFILQQFSQYGTILKYLVVPDCNWMHIRYMTKIQARKALKNDGKTYGGRMKVGVIPCTKKDAMEEKKNLRSVYSSPAFDLLARSQSDLSSGSPTPLRPLMAAYAAARADQEVLQGKPIPQLDASLLAKLKEYMFGY